MLALFVLSFIFIKQPAIASFTIISGIIIIFNSLKLNDKESSKLDNLKCETIEFSNLKLDIYYDNSGNEQEQLEKLTKEREKLISSIERREKLLSNENYLNKAPEQIVNAEKENLAKDKERLIIIEKNLSK